MELKNYIEAAEKKAGSQTELAKMLGISAGYLRNAKAKKSGLPDALCIKMAELINENPLHIIAASGLVTEKDEERRKILESCFKKVASVASIALVTTMLTLPAAKPVNAENLTIQFQKIFVIGNINFFYYFDKNNHDTLHNIRLSGLIRTNDKGNMWHSPLFNIYI